MTTAASATGSGSGSVCLPGIDFEKDAAGTDLYAGQIVDDIAGVVASGVSVTTGNVAKPAMIFDTANPTGGDVDLGTPNTDFGGLGVGSGGAAGKDGQNALALNKVLIISEDGDSNDPDDSAAGGTLTFTFDRPVFVERVQVIDIDEGMAGDVTAFDGGGTMIGTAAMLDNRGDNSVQTVQLGASGVEKLEIYFPGSGAVSELVFCDQSVCVPQVDFDARADGSVLYAGDVIDNVAGAIDGATVTSGDPGHLAMIFDSANPTGGDADLGTPNLDFGGPGLGSGGSATGAGPNVDPQGNILIVSEDNDSMDPDDDAAGGTLTFDFDQPTWIDSVDVLDIDCGETGGTVKALDAGGVVIASRPIADLCNNSFQTVAFGIGDVSSLAVDLPSSGAVVRVRSCECSVNPIKLTFGKKQVRWLLKNVGADPVTADQISIEWPPINGNLKKIKLGPNTIWTGNLPPFQATLTADQLDLVPLLSPGEKRPLRFIFKRAVDQTPERYTISVDFAQGCSVEREGTEPLPECNIAAGAALEFGTSQVRWQLTNGGTQTVNIDAVTLEDWPDSTNGDLIKILLGSQAIADAASADLPAAVPPVTVTDYNVATSLALAPGESKKLKLNFANPVDALGFYDLAVDITTEDGLQFCPVNIEQGDTPICGNGTVDPGEQCDDGNTTPGDGCSATCQVEVCGNGTVDPGEQCDDNNTVGGDGCSATCQVEACGNGVVDVGEACDDAGESATCDANCTTASCGDGTLNTTSGEACDDNNTVGGDGCSATCQVEATVTCPCASGAEPGWSDFGAIAPGFSFAGQLWSNVGGFPAGSTSCTGNGTDTVTVTATLVDGSGVNTVGVTPTQCTASNNAAPPLTVNGTLALTPAEAAQCFLDLEAASPVACP